MQKQLGATLLFCDNRSTVSIAKIPTLHARIKYIDLRYHFIRGLIVDGFISLDYCTIEEQAVEIFTKPLSVPKHAYFHSPLNVCSFESKGDQ